MKLFKRCIPAWLIAFGASVPPVAAQDAAQSTLSGSATIALPNPDFEGEFKAVAPFSDAPDKKAIITGQIAAGWGDNSDWAEVNVDYARETGNPHRGAAAQRISVKNVTAGAVQFVQNATFRKGRVHVWRVWLRGQAGTGLTLMMRKGGAPYTEYASQTVSLGAEWQEYRVFGVIPEDADGFLMIRTTAPMTFVVDDSTLEDLTSAQSDAPARVGNLLPSGGSFEAGMPYGWSVRFEGPPQNRYADPRPAFDSTTAAHGKTSLRCDILPGDNVAISSPLFGYNFGRTHTVSLWLKASRPDVYVSVELSKTGLNQTVKVGAQWQRFTLSGTLPFLPSTLLRVHCGSEYTKTGLTLWLDGVSVEEKAAASPEYSAPQPIELSLQLPNPGHVLFDGEKAHVRVLTAGALPTGAHMRCTATRLSADNKVERIWSVPLPSKYFALPDFKARRGMWKLSAEVVDKSSKVLSPQYQLIWARLPHPRDIDPTKSYFGAHIQLSPYYIALARAIGVRRVRLHDTSMIGKWAIAEVEPGVWRYYDEGVTHAKKSGLAILGMLDGAPRWVSTKPREGYWGIWHIPDAPGALDKWETYVRNVTTHYRGRIDQWEVWNEPWGNWFDGAGGPPELYGQLMQRAYRVAKKANPKALILGVDAYPRNGWTPRVMPFVPPKFYDGFSYHEYNDAVFGGPQAIPFLRAKEFHDWQAQYGTPRPLWNTEGGLFGVGSWYVPEAGGMDARLQPAYIVRYDVTHMAAGVRAFWLYAIHTDGPMGEVETRTTEHDRAVKPILAARAVLASLVDGLGTPKCSEPVKGVDLYTYPRDAKTKRTVSVLWSYDGADHAVGIPRGAKVWDVWGNPIPVTTSIITAGPEPKYFVR